MTQSEEEHPEDYDINLKCIGERTRAMLEHAIEQYIDGTKEFKSHILKIETMPSADGREMKRAIEDTIKEYEHLLEKIRSVPLCKWT